MKTEMEKIMEQITSLYEQKDGEIQELMKHFGPVLKTIVKTLNITVLEDIESLMVAYVCICLIIASMSHFDLFTFLPHLWSHEDFLKPFVLHSKGRNAGYLFI